MHEDCIYKSVCQAECKSMCIRYAEMQYLLDLSNLPKAQQKFHKLKAPQCDLENYRFLANIQSNIEEFVKDGKILYLYSKESGNGKTTWTIKLLLQYFNEVWACNGFHQRGIFINVPTYLLQCKNAITTPDDKLPMIQNGLLNADLAVLDDVVTNNLSNYDYSQLISYVDSRVANGKAMLVTSNYTPTELPQLVGDRLASRLCSGYKIELKGRDMRNGTMSIS